MKVYYGIEGGGDITDATLARTSSSISAWNNKDLTHVGNGEYSVGLTAEQEGTFTITVTLEKNNGGSGGCGYESQTIVFTVNVSAGKL